VSSKRRYGRWIGDTTQHHTGFTTDTTTVRDVVALHQSVATAFRHRYHRPHFFSRDLSLSRKAAAGIRCAEVNETSPKDIVVFSSEKNLKQENCLGY
jgi:hypothetical protein